ncbi:MAG: acetyltransferase [Acidobacteria bacterium]|jgi:aminoglycoside 6'-N-acetyltransferase|nr:acetyltransferase [Acidobacteriota bacterium]
MSLVLRPATPDDIPTLERWDHEPHVIRATSDDLDQPKAFGDLYWPDEFALIAPDYQYYIAEENGRPVGAMQIIDPHTESTHYWGEVEPHLRALDIWIGDTSDLDRGLGTAMMQLAFKLCFADAAVTAIIIDPLASNTRAHTFYQRLGFRPEGLRKLGDDDDICLVHRLTREDWLKLFSGE